MPVAARMIQNNIAKTNPGSPPIKLLKQWPKRLQIKPLANAITQIHIACIDNREIKPLFSSFFIDINKPIKE
jgi:hypothetical protein